MTSKLNTALLGTALLMLAGYSAAETPSDPSIAGLDASVIVTGAHFTDRQIRAEVLKRFGETPRLATENIDVQSFDHTVYLRGTVTGRTDSEQAEAIARTVPGVKNVYNALGSIGA